MGNKSNKNSPVSSNDTNIYIVEAMPARISLNNGSQKKSALLLPRVRHAYRVFPCQEIEPQKDNSDSDA